MDPTTEIDIRIVAIYQTGVININKRDITLPQPIDNRNILLLNIISGSLDFAEGIIKYSNPKITIINKNEWTQSSRIFNERIPKNIAIKALNRIHIILK